AEVYTLRGHTDPIYGVAFSPAPGLTLAGPGSAGPPRLVSASQDHTVKGWDLNTGREALTIRAHADTARAAAFSHAGRRLAPACVHGSVTLWDATPPSDETPPYPSHTLAGHGAAVFIAAFHPDGRHLLALSDNETIRTWDLDACREVEARRLSVEPQIHSL